MVDEIKTPEKPQPLNSVQEAEAWLRGWGLDFRDRATLARQVNSLAALLEKFRG